MNQIKQPDEHVPLELNARVDKVGRDHKGGHIYKVTIGDQEPLYLSDARLEFGIPIVTEVPTVHSHVHSGVSHPDQVKTTGEEPSIHGLVSGGLSAAWLDWYRSQGKGCTLIEARDAGLLRLAEVKRERNHDRKSD